MPTVSTKQQQHHQTLILSFTVISALDDSDAFITEPININDLALVRFKLQHKPPTGRSGYTLESSMTLKKIVKPMSSTYIHKIRVTCEAFDKELDCSDDWVEITLLSKNRGNVDVENNAVISMLEVKLTAYEKQTQNPPPQKLKLYDDEELTDFHLTAADGNVGIHKALLAMHSDVFMMMFKREWKETLAGEIAIKGVTRQTLQDLKQYIYLGSLPNEGLEPLLVIAERYMMDELKADCIAKMVKNVTPEKLDDLVEFACLNNMPNLMRAVLFETPDTVVTDLYKLKMTKKEAKDENN